MKAITISVLARRFSLSRSTLLYYDRIGLLRPSKQSVAGYRLYAEPEVTRLQRIVELRAAGLPLQRIREVLDRNSPLAATLEQQLAQINTQIDALRAQQRVLLAMLGQPALARQGKSLDKQTWTGMFRAIGLEQSDMLRWHAEFERMMPQAHQDFLQSLGLTDEEVKSIRERSAVAEP